VDPDTTFAQVSVLTPVARGRFGAAISPEWTVAGHPNGGYLLAMACRAAAAMGSHPHVIAASAHYLRSPEAGPVQIEAEVLRAGRAASQVRARMSQGGEPCMEALVTTSELDPGAEPHWDKGGPEPGTVRYEDCVRIPARGPGGLRVSIYDQVQARLEPDSLGFAAGHPSGRGELRGWLALPADEPFDPFSLVYAADSYPPATFDIELSGWVPTLELTVYVRALPAPGPVRILQRVHLIDGQRVDEECVVWDRTGRLVAQGRQLAAIRLG
jgi:acyl-Coa thioesterase superfamily protein/acyl-CoA thioesterase superfamily protein